jgi:hypothetical protein
MWKKILTNITNATGRWQEVWSARFTWAEGEFDSFGNLTVVVCVICRKIEGRKKIIVSKGDNLETHEEKRLCVQAGIPYPDLEVGDIFMKKDYKHLKNQELWSARQNVPTVYKQLLCGLHGENTRKGVQFSTLFQILSHGHPMVDYCESQHLLRYLNVKNVPKKHWCETSGWEMSEHIEVVVLDALRKLIRNYTIFSLSVDEVITIDMTYWVSVHVHIMEGWERVPHLLHISYVSEPGTADHLTESIMPALISEGGLTREEIASKLVCFGVDGVSTFQGHKSGVTI